MRKCKVFKILKTQEVRQMLGLHGYYQKFIPAHANLVWLLKQWTCKTFPFIGTDQCQNIWNTERCFNEKP